jgi:hypothetical protein
MRWNEEEEVARRCDVDGDTAVAQHWRRVLYPHSPFGLVARVQQHTRGTKPLPVRPNRRPALSRVRDLDPQTPWYNGRAGRCLSFIGSYVFARAFVWGDVDPHSWGNSQRPPPFS